VLGMYGAAAKRAAQLPQNIKPCFQLLSSGENSEAEQTPSQQPVSARHLRGPAG
jgi:hypothetical protein